MTWQEKQLEYEVKKARAKALKLRLTCTICGDKAKLNCPCGTTQYCSVACQKIDWRERGHRKACKKIRDERAAEAARAEAPTPPPSPPREVFYGPAPRSHADEIRARIAAEHEAARARREANPEPEPASARFGGCCPICLEKWDVNANPVFRGCCCRLLCASCEDKVGIACPFCHKPSPRSYAESLARVRRHVENEVPEAIHFLGTLYREGAAGLVKSDKKAAKLFKRAVELGSVNAMVDLAMLYYDGRGVKLDRKKSMQLDRMAAARGDASAECNLGGLYRENGDLDSAFRYFRLAADKGYMEAEMNVGNCYLTGAGVQADIDEAERWYKRAASKGDEKAVYMLNQLISARSSGHPITPVTISDEDFSHLGAVPGLLRGLGRGVDRSSSS